MAIVRAAVAKEASMTDTAAHCAPRMESRAPGMVRVWDPLARLFHGSLVTGFAVAC